MLTNKKNGGARRASSSARHLDLAPGDTVMVMAGKDRGKTGEVLRAMPTQGRIVVRGVNDVRAITGQQPIVVKARKSVAAFKLRAGMPVGIKATLRGRRMWYFLERLISVALPRIRDFRGVSPEGFDGRGNYSLGLREQIIFPEVDYDKIDKIRGLEVSIVTTARTDDEARSLLTKLGMPFRKRGAQ